MAHYSTIHDQGSDLPPCKPATSIGYAERLPPASPDVERTEVADAYETTAEDNTMKEYSKFTEWRLEMLSWALGTAIIGGIVAILAKFNDTPAAEWSASIQISTVVAFLAQIAQAALLYVVISRCKHLTMPRIDNTLTMCSVSQPKHVLANSNGCGSGRTAKRLTCRSSMWLVGVLWGV